VDTIAADLRLAAAGRVEITGGRITVLDQRPAGDEELDSAVRSIADARWRSRAGGWVSRPRRGIREAYLNRLAQEGAVSMGESAVLRQRRWRVTDSERLGAARQRLEAIARSEGPVTVEQRAYAGLAHAIGLGQVVYPGWANRSVRARLRDIAAGRARTADPAGPGGAASAAIRATGHAATSAATQAAANAATDAATNAAVQASTDAAMQTAIQASIAAAAASAASSAASAPM
jgi:hypothetical protein